MHIFDYILIFGYLAAVLGIGVYFLKKQTSVEEYFVGNRKMGASHLGFSIVATDVGGGFSIGLAGLGYTMGLSGSWLLFTGLIGAWLAAVIVVPRVKKLGTKHGFLTYPDFLEKRFGTKTRSVAAVVSGLGYAGFVGAQILAGAKLCSAAFGIEIITAVAIMAAVIIIYTSFGGLEAVVYTDSIQWAVLLVGLCLFAIPFVYHEIGGWTALSESLPASHFDLTNITIGKFVTWMFTIIPIWFVAMTLYQRIYAARDEKTAKRAFYFAGLLEWPLMAFMGVILGLFSRVLYPSVDPEMGLPLLIKNMLPIGITGIVLAAYFAAIMSTADSCLLASVGNIINDVYQKHINPDASEKKVLRLSRIATITVGIASVSIAILVPNILKSILLAYSFMVSGLFCPTIAGLLWKRVSSRAALMSMLFGGITAVVLDAFPMINPFESSIVISLPVSAIALLVGTALWPRKAAK